MIRPAVFFTPVSMTLSCWMLTLQKPIPAVNRRVRHTLNTMIRLASILWSSTNFLATCWWSLAAPREYIFCCRSTRCHRRSSQSLPNTNSKGEERQIQFKGDAAFYQGDLMDLFEIVPFLLNMRSVLKALDVWKVPASMTFTLQRPKWTLTML